MEKKRKSIIHLPTTKTPKEKKKKIGIPTPFVGHQVRVRVFGTGSGRKRRVEIRMRLSTVFVYNIKGRERIVGVTHRGDWRRHDAPFTLSLSPFSNYVCV